MRLWYHLLGNVLKKIPTSCVYKGKGRQGILNRPYPLLFVPEDHCFFKDINLRILPHFSIVIGKILVYKFLMKSKNKDKRINLAYRPEKISNLAAIFLFIDQFWKIVPQNLCLDEFYRVVSPKVQFDVKLTLL